MPDPFPISMVDLPAEHAAYRGELSAAIEAVLSHGQFISGPEVRAFEEEVARYLGVPQAVGCNSGSDALVLALRALGIGPGDEVVTTTMTFFATAEAVTAVGATPVFVDIEESTFNIDVDQVAEAMTPRTKAVIPVHLYGQPADLDRLLPIAAEHGAAVVEDTAQACGALLGDRQAGTLGTCGTYSFFPTKPLGGMGDGGLVVTFDAAVAERLRMLRAHGARAGQKYVNEVVGYNSRLDTLQAAILRVKLRRLDDANKARQRVAQHYDGRFQGVEGMVIPFTAPGRTHVYHAYTVRILDGRRDSVREALEGAGISSMVYYPVPVHRLPVYGTKQPSLPRAEQAAAEVLSLPISPVLGEDVADVVADAVLGALTGGQ